MITNAVICRETGQYDPEIITRLRLERLGIQRISNLEQCSSLVELSLAWNSLTSMTGLDSLVTLKRIDLSHNQIRKIEGLHNLINLEWLDLRANQITNIDDVSNLSPLPLLHGFALRGPEGEDANPACQHPAYYNVIMRALRALDILDGTTVVSEILPLMFSNSHHPLTTVGGHVNVLEETENIAKRLEAIVPDESLCKTPPIERWLPVVDVDTEPDLLSLGTAGAVGVPPETTRAFASAQEAMQNVQDYINMEMKRSLFKADTLATKATTS